MEEALEASLYLESFEITSEHDDIIDVTAESSSEKDVRDELFFEFADKKLPIVKMETENLSLEDVFLKLTGQDIDEMQNEENESQEEDQEGDGK